jgi:hypothetical protein
MDYSYPDSELQHFGVKGMKWGVRKSRSSSSSPKEPPSEDFRKAAQIRTKMETSGKKSLSNKELKDLTERLQLERKLGTVYTNNTRQAKMKRGAKTVGKLMFKYGAAPVGMAAGMYISNQIKNETTKKIEAGHKKANTKYKSGTEKLKQDMIRKKREKEARDKIRKPPLISDDAFDVF